MSRLPLSFTLCSLIVGTALLAAPNVQAKDSEIKDGIPGTVVKVDVAQGTVTIAEKEGRERTYTVNQETQIIGPRGGIVHSRLNDHRFHAGLPITVVANGTTAAELHLGYDRKARAGRTTSSRASTTTAPAETPATTDSGAATPPANPAPTPAPSTTRTTRFRGVEARRAAAKDAKEEEEDEDNEFPGKIKSVDPTRHMLVITLVNGKDRSFLVSSEAKVLVNSRASRHGLGDPALQPGAALTVVTEEGGRKVKEVKLTPAARRLRKAS
jgi:hypothetical protein